MGILAGRSRVWPHQPQPLRREQRPDQEPPPGALGLFIAEPLSLRGWGT